MLFREAKMILYQGGTGEIENKMTDKDYLGNDNFFTVNYEQRFSMTGQSEDVLKKLKMYDEKFRLKTSLVGY